jgi:hypothetical protein
VNSKILHGESSAPEYTLCGDAFDAFESGDADEPIVFANAGQVVTCTECRRAIDYVRKHYRKYKFLGDI